MDELYAMTAITVSCIISNILRTGCARYAEFSLLLSAKKEYLEAAEVTYKLTSFILCTKYKFDKRKLNLLQRYVKNDMWALIDGKCKLTEFFWMLHTECRLEFGALDGWMKRYGKIYGEDGMPI